VIVAGPVVAPIEFGVGDTVAVVTGAAVSTWKKSKLLVSEPAAAAAEYE
jgi:hypothetical protein